MSNAAYVILGAGGHGRELGGLASRARPDLRCLGYLDDGLDPGEYAFGTVLGPLAKLEGLGCQFIAAIGDPSVRRVVAGEAEKHSSPLSLVDPTAVVGPRCELGRGVLIGPGCVLTSDVEIGPHSHLHSNTTISHDTSIGSFVTITPSVAVSGSVRIGDEVWLGVGSVVSQGLTVGQRALVGAGAVVVSEVRPGRTVVGVPAREIRRRRPTV